MSENFTIKAGTPVSITAAGLYSTYDAKKPSSYLTGNYYIYDDKVRMDKVRICDSLSKVGKPCTRTGWFKLDDLIFDSEKESISDDNIEESDD